MTDFRRRARQLRFPREFRISEPASPGPAQDEPEPEPVIDRLPAAPSDMDDATVADIVTNLWRVRKRFTGDDEVPKAQRLAARNLTSMSDRLAEAGVRVQDHDDLVWDPGMSLKALAYEPRSNLDRETVVDTVRPSIYRGGQCIQLGHVIVGVPEKGQDDGSRDD
ncbi:hypothetical protein [Amycolatopsis nigrescens]|uniref:hypothetical protein n=1 Tax=Amycolatopsis nigrescens TaxID=381445 RepID=UPI00146E4A67|nr:hypothetical protein [Amycolatopsis nigrescens]